ncbi:MAG: geranylgeranylglycerol-phosphate geranylgeranyltransferase [Candidatus Marinimicrobia bacterium]|nr:geranylgeranylglycerol-phosphate geranylgeranyltransferase [Candidatus Neomarinimicrobiota bacterium]
MISKGSAFFKILRPLNIFQSAVAVIITATLFANIPPLSIILLGIFVTASFLGGGNAINDYFDAEIDQINRPGRPIPSGRLTKQEVMLFSALSFSAGIMAFIPIATTISTLILVINLVLLILYTPMLKPTAFWGNLTVSYLLGSTFLFSAEIFGELQKGTIPAILAFLFNLARELIKDMEDLEGDRKNHLRTLPIMIGPESSKKISALFIVIILAFCFVPYSLQIYGLWYLLAVIFSVEIPLLFVLYLLRISNEKRDYSRISNIMKILVFCGLISIYLGKF